MFTEAPEPQVARPFTVSDPVIEVAPPKVSAADELMFTEPAPETEPFSAWAIALLIVRFVPEASVQFPPIVAAVPVNCVVPDCTL